MEIINLKEILAPREAALFTADAAETRLLVAENERQSGL